MQNCKCFTFSMPFHYFISLPPGLINNIRYIFYCTWFCNPFWRKQVLPEGDNYNPFFRKRDGSEGGDCSAKINIYIRKPDASSAVYDEYLYYDPPLPCVIEIAGQHNHSLNCSEEKGINDKLRKLVPDDLVKREFFKYFQMGISVSDAKKKYTMHYRQKKPPKTLTVLIPTIRQAEILYKEWQEVKGNKQWQNVKDSLDTKLKEGIIILFLLIGFISYSSCNIFWNA
ncbi:unnamed protein product [Larinioides sclopetarius]|uniref:LAGLIDADG homing endonuclease n=1 Tax=Larinioides sclopetarius TaxID=280406 RepID=A0AAV1YZG4_9ARAC